MNENIPSPHRYQTLRHYNYSRQASLSEVERSFLSHLLIDIPITNDDDDNDDDEMVAVLNEEILFSLPTTGLLFSSSSSSSALEDIIASSEHDSVRRRRRRSSHHHHTTTTTSTAAQDQEGDEKKKKVRSDVWKAYHHGVILRPRREVGVENIVGDESRRRSSTNTGTGGGEIRTRRFWQRRERSSGIGGGEVRLRRRIGMEDNDAAVAVTDNDVNHNENLRGGDVCGGVMNVGDKESNNDDIDNDSSLLGNNNNSNYDDTKVSNDNVTNDADTDYNNENDVDVQSDNEVGTIHDESSASSWNSSQGGFDHYDAWEVMHDEYAPEFGYQVAEEEGSIIASDQGHSDDDDDDYEQPRPFKILGTSAYDASALPHVLSPPLMDSLLNFVPEHLWNSNYWLKYSLVRDGASLDILRRYCRAATHTILAIETTNGDVFGSFTSAPWTCRQHRPSSANTTGSGFYGTGESFLWRMRSNRNTPVHSLFEQAQLESEIDVYPYNGSNDYVQLCTRDMLALGGGGGGGGGGSGDGCTHPQPLDDDDAPPVVLEDMVNYGFGLALDKYLLHGTTSPSATFGNSNLTSHRTNIDNDVVGGGEAFDVQNLEVWGFTSANTVSSAQKSEMSVYFARESLSSSMASTSSMGYTGNSFGGGRSDHLFEADDLSQDRFYRRIGRDDENEVDRTAWQYANMMNPVAGSSPYGTMGSSSPFGR